MIKVLIIVIMLCLNLHTVYANNLIDKIQNSWQSSQENRQQLRDKIVPDEQKQPQVERKKDDGLFSSYHEIKQDVIDLKESVKKFIFASLFSTVTFGVFIVFSYFLPFSTGILLRWATYCIMLSIFLQMLS